MAINRKYLGIYFFTFEVPIWSWQQVDRARTSSSCELGHVCHRSPGAYANDLVKYPWFNLKFKSNENKT